MTLRCSKCKEHKAISEFFRRKALKRGYNLWCKPCCRTYANTRYRTSGEKERRRKNTVSCKYGLSFEEYSKLLVEQNYSCAICNNKETSKYLAVDHNHNTGKVRGLLCGNCNMALGSFKDSIEMLEKAIKYLNNY